jgi:predicted nuclease of predicted toxin-antitoxin system
MPQADDADILTRATAERRVVVTNDKDFGELVFRSGRAHQGILLLRLRDDSAANRVRVVKSVLDGYGDRLAGHFVVATDNNVRVRPVGQ